MEDTAKYLIHADFLADGVVERSDVVGAVFGQTEGLLGDDLDIRGLQQSSKLGRIDVEVHHESGQSVGEITIASSLDRVETATLAAALEAIERIGPSHAAVEVGRIEDVRAAKRRGVVDRAKELLATAFDEGVMDSDAILDEVRESIRVEDITEYAGYPAGPNVETSDAIIVVEGRSDVLTLLKYGVKNAIAVEGTNVPEAVADLTIDKTVTAFLDGDRGGDLIRRELAQVGDLDYVAVAPDDKSVEDLSRSEVDVALRNKEPAETYEGSDAEAAITDGSTTHASPVDVSARNSGDVAAERNSGDVASETPTTAAENASGGAQAAGSSSEGDPPATHAGTAQPMAVGETLADHVAAVVGSDRTRLLDESMVVIEEASSADGFETLCDAETVPHVVVLDGEVTQRLVDLAAQRGVAEIVGTDRGTFVKQPTSVRVRTREDISS
ncbi:DNA primase DnaG [Halanaeroarchaeum sulfurireducens]|uniref:DNA primase DnaG n=1 Tax=Halanaeroarchaeum sulfurireducens TaxID=1604004 RepID=A0A0N9N6M6_9EURY|nr:DNA primase DnaG [Halanaeroarchaeum sulfurireducens]ALG82718.1 DNA primase [Halanaeroarchaeum sulfurireducens]